MLVPIHEPQHSFPTHMCREEDAGTGAVYLGKPPVTGEQCVRTAARRVATVGGGEVAVDAVGNQGGVQRPPSARLLHMPRVGGRMTPCDDL